MSPEIRIQPATGSSALKQICHVVNAVSPEQRMNAEDLAHYLASNRGAVLLLAHAGADVAGAVDGRSGRTAGIPVHDGARRARPEATRRGLGPARGGSRACSRARPATPLGAAVMLAVNRRLGYRVIAENVMVEGLTEFR